MSVHRETTRFTVVLKVEDLTRLGAFVTRHPDGVRTLQALTTPNTIYLDVKNPGELRQLACWAEWQAAAWEGELASDEATS